MAHARLSTKGQLVIPREIRERHGWRAGDKFEVLERDGVLLLRKAPDRPASTTIDQVAGMLATPRAPLTVEQMNAAVGDEVRRRWSSR